MAAHTPDVFDLAKAHFNKLEYSPHFWHNQLQSSITPTTPQLMLLRAMTGTFSVDDMRSYVLNAQIDLSNTQFVKQHDMILYAVVHLYPEFHNNPTIAVIELLNYQLFNTAYYLPRKYPPTYAKPIFNHILLHTHAHYINTLGVGRLLVLLDNMISQRDGGQMWVHKKLAQSDWLPQFKFVVCAWMGWVPFDHNFINPDVGIEVMLR